MMVCSSAYVMVCSSVYVMVCSSAYVLISSALCWLLMGVLINCVFLRVFHVYEAGIGDALD